MMSGKQGVHRVKISLGSDHGGLQLKQDILRFLSAQGFETTDRGSFTAESVDYPDFAELVCQDVVAKRAERGILICGTGIGMSIAANKHTGIRAALCHDTFSARATREHNDSNVLCLGQRVIGSGLALDIVAAWLGAGFSGGRHQVRLDKISRIEDKIKSNC